MFAKVIVDIASSLVDKVFDYSFDDEQISQYKPGTRVLVPFGNRCIEGYVLEISQTCNFEPSKIKKIIRPLESFVCINQDQFELAKFMKQKFNIGLSDCFRLFLPAEMRNGKVKDLEVVELFLQDEEKAKIYFSSLKANAHSQKDAILFMLEKGSFLQSELNKKFGSSAISKLKENQIFLARTKVLKRKPYENIKISKTEKVVLTFLQENAKQKILKSSRPILLHGVTGSGKTEVYMSCIDEVLKKQKTAILLVPEISLTPQVLSSFRNRFGEEVALLHSGLSAGERFDEWKRILLGDAKIVIGARSAIFAPLSNIGIIIIDESHDGSYVSESNPRYNTIDVAIKRAECCSCPLVLGSATPDIETYFHATNGDFELVEMKERINKKPLPPINIVDMTREIREGNPDIFSRKLKEALEKTIENQNQAMLFINRRGFASFLMCRNCGWVAKCDQCDVSLVLHKHDNALKCHYCDKRYKVFTTCPECGSDDIKQGAIGTERVVQELQKMFPNVGILRMDNDTTSRKGAHAQILSDFKEKKAQILVGTQMIAKGHDFPSVTLVGIVDADVSLHQSSFKATEKTFNLITQVAGRAGRADKQGEIILQTYAPRHYIYRLASIYDYAGFFRKEINLREVASYPPFAKIVRILFISFDEDLVKNTTKEYYDMVKALKDEFSDQFIYLGVMKAPVGRIENKFRFQILTRIRNEKSDEIIRKIYDFTEKNKNKNISIFVEINPEVLN